MSNETLNSKCPSCGAPSTQPIILEECSRAKSNIIESFDSIISTCITPNKLEEFHNDGIPEDPCMYCEYNTITEIPGSFVEMQQGASINSWLEVHVCPNCKTKYSVNPQINATQEL